LFQQRHHFGIAVKEFLQFLLLGRLERLGRASAFREYRRQFFLDGLQVVPGAAEERGGVFLRDDRRAGQVLERDRVSGGAQLGELRFKPGTIPPHEISVDPKKYRRDRRHDDAGPKEQLLHENRPSLQIAVP
jgi:hypothetical protein